MEGGRRWDNCHQRSVTVTITNCFSVADNSPNVILATYQYFRRRGELCVPPYSQTRASQCTCSFRRLKGKYCPSSGQRHTRDVSHSTVASVHARPSRGPPSRTMDPMETEKDRFYQNDETLRQETNSWQSIGFVYLVGWLGLSVFQCSFVWLIDGSSVGWLFGWLFCWLVD